MKWIVLFSTASAGSVAAVLLALWGLNGFADLGLRGNGLAALILGIVLTTALGIALMALTFHSGRSHHDDMAYRSRAPDDSDG